MKNKILYYLSVTTIILAAVMIGYVLFYSLYPFQTVDYSNSPFPILNENKIVRAGEEIKYEVKYCRYTDLVTHATRSLENDRIYTFQNIDVKSPEGCHTSITGVLIPKDITPGTYKLVSTLTWNINAFRAVVKQVETEEFIVISEEK
jgi:hypothetical protein